MQITPLKFESVWILHPKVSEFRFYSLKFWSVWILDLDVSEFGFYIPKFGGIWILNSQIEGVWILNSQIVKLQNVISKHLQTLRGKIKFLKLQGLKS